MPFINQKMEVKTATISMEKIEIVSRFYGWRRMGDDHMNIYISCELIALAMLAITLFFYNYKNWIDIKKNRSYLELLHWTIAAVVMDLIGNVLLVLLPAYTEIIEIVSGMFMSVLMLGIFFQFYLYDMAYVQVAKEYKKAELILMNIITAFGLLLTLLSPVIGYDTLQKMHITEAYGRGNRIQIMILILCMISGLIHVIANRRKLTRREFTILVFSNSVLLFNLVVEIFLHTGNLASYYLLAIILVTYYMLLHNMDRYRFKLSGCFARVGFYTVLKEREIYKENFYCLGVAIKNIESITNYCTEDEIGEFHHRIGMFLQKNCGKHTVYHTHSFEYMLLFSSEDQVVKKHKFLLEKLPDYIRINDKNVALSVDYYAVEFADADYTMENFYSVITSMRKLASKQGNKETLIHYHGNRQRDIEKNLEAMRVVNHSITSRHFLLETYPIQLKRDPEKFSLEVAAHEQLEDGEMIPQEELWHLSERMGLTKEFGKAELEQICKYIAEKELVTSPVKKVHVNMTSIQLEDMELAREYIAILKKYHIPGKFICFEVNLNQNSDYEALAEVFGALRGYGISFLLDQFGVSVCSLKSVINMPFDAVKINHRITKAYCEGTSSQLTYLIDMFSGRHWKVVIDGVDEVVWEQKLSDLQFSYAQGAHIKRLYDHKQPSSVKVEEIGGALVG